MSQEQSEIALMMPAETTTLRVETAQELGSLNQYRDKPLDMISSIASLDKSGPSIFIICSCPLAILSSFMYNL